MWPCGVLKYSATPKQYLVDLKIKTHQKLIETKSGLLKKRVISFPFCLLEPLLLKTPLWQE